MLCHEAWNLPGRCWGLVSGSDRGSLYSGWREHVSLADAKCRNHRRPQAHCGRVPELGHWHCQHHSRGADSAGWPSHVSFSAPGPAHSIQCDLDPALNTVIKYYLCRYKSRKRICVLGVVAPSCDLPLFKLHHRSYTALRVKSNLLQVICHRFNSTAG